MRFTHRAIAGLWPVYLILLTWIVSVTLFSTEPAELFGRYWHFFVIGLIGAIVANSTGSGGGIIFIPFFAVLGLTATEALATSLLIQCFGMTAGSISWLRWTARSRSFSQVHRQLQYRLLIVGGSTCILGILTAQYLLPSPTISISTIFKAFSVFFGVALLLYVLVFKTRAHRHSHLNFTDHVIVAAVGLLGGMITAWISIGVGEWVALAVIFLRYPTMIAVSTGVCLSSIAVLTAAPLHIYQGNVVWEVVLFAAPAAIIGGLVARFLAHRLGARRLKIFFGLWILLTAAWM